MIPWVPRTPPAGLVARAVAVSPAWRRYLVANGYTPPELGPVLEGRGRADAPGLVAAVEASVRAVPAEGQAQARAGAVARYLAAHPPLRVTRLDHRPEAYLTAEAFGARLVPQAAGPAEVQVLEDLATGRRWWTVGEEGETAGLAVVAGVLYRLADVGAPAARLVELEGVRRAVHPEPVAWEPLEGQVLELQAAQLRAELPIDAWVGWRGGLAGMRARGQVLPRGMFPTLRLELGDALGRARGRAVPFPLDAQALQELQARPPWSTVAPLELGPAARRLVGISDRAIRQAVALGELEDDQAARLVATLQARRDLVARSVLELIGGADRGR